MADYLDKDYLLSLGNIDQEFLNFINNANLPAVDYGNLQAFRQLVNDRSAMAKKVMGPVPEEMTLTELQYPASDGHKLRAMLFQPKTPPSEGSPLIVLVHGGGWACGTPDSEEASCRMLTQAFGAVCVSIAYRLGPEDPFPYAANDTWDGLKWAATQAKAWGADPSCGFVVGGTSAGGNLSAILALRARDEGLSPPLTGQWLAVPCVLQRDRVPEKYKPWHLSYDQNGDAPILPTKAIDMFMGAYKPDFDSPLFDAFNNPNGHQNLPPALLQICGMDTLRDEGILYERKLREDGGVQTQLFVYPGVPHAHWGFFPFLNSADKFRREQLQGFEWLLKRSADSSKVIFKTAMPSAAP